LKRSGFDPEVERDGQAGPVVVPLCGPCESPASGTANATAAVLDALQDGGTYVNVHTATNGPGEIRGQLGVTASVRTTLTSRQEVPRPKGNVRRATGTFTADSHEIRGDDEAQLAAHVRSADGSSCFRTYPRRPARSRGARCGRPLRAVPKRRAKDGDAAALGDRSAGSGSCVRERAHGPKSRRRDPRSDRGGTAHDLVTDCSCSYDDAPGGTARGIV
jgi:hypothetical protein